MKSIFYNRAEKRLRSGWRILVFLILFWCLAAVALAIKPLFGPMTKREYLEGFSLIIVGVLAISATLSVWISRKYLDKGTFGSLGMKPCKRGWTDLLFGFLLSAGMAGLFLFTAVKLNLVEITSINWEHRSFDLTTFTGYTSMMQTFAMATLVVLLLEHILVGYWEELVFRGYLFQNMSAGMGRLAAILLSCGIYGAVHFMNPNATLLSSSIIILFCFLKIYG